VRNMWGPALGASRSTLQLPARVSCWYRLAFGVAVVLLSIATETSAQSPDARCTAWPRQRVPAKSDPLVFEVRVDKADLDLGSIPVKLWLSNPSSDTIDICCHLASCV
jgi:hypothetical protein